MNTENISVEQLVNSFSTLYEQATSTAIAVLENESIQDGIALLNDTADELSNAIGSLKALKAVASIPTKLFMNKFERYCKGIADIPIEKRQRYLEKLGKRKINEESVFILNVINRVEELGKLDIFLKLLEAKLDEVLDDEEFRRYIIRVDHTLLCDLAHMKENLTNDDFYLDCIQMEGLANAGWIVYSGMSILDAADSRRDPNLYHYSASAKKFCEIVYGVIANDEVTQGPIRSVALETTE